MSIPILEQAMRGKVPAAKIVTQSLPLVPEIKLALIDDAYPQADLTSEQVTYLMDEPPYWAFCWASGQVMARYLIDEPEQVRGKTVVDFGCGSGVAAIAAAMAGAKRSIALDIDPNALLASKTNSTLNQTAIETHCDITQLGIDPSSAILLIADVFYDRDNIPLLQDFINDYYDVIVADSRVKPSELSGMRETARYESCTIPDLAEASDFNSVGVYRKS